MADFNDDIIKASDGGKLFGKSYSLEDAIARLKAEGKIVIRATVSDSPKGDDNNHMWDSMRYTAFSFGRVVDGIHFNHGFRDEFTQPLEFEFGGVRYTEKQLRSLWKKIYFATHYGAHSDPTVRPVYFEEFKEKYRIAKWQDAEVVEPLALPPYNGTATRKRPRIKHIKIFTTDGNKER